MHDSNFECWYVCVSLGGWDMNILTKIKTFLWYLGLITNCPKCGAGVLKVGFDFPQQRYVCSTNSCSFGKGLK